MIRLILGSTLAFLTVTGCGRNTGQTTDPATNPIKGDPAKAKFSWIKANVYDGACIGCHNAAKPLGHVDLTSYEKSVEGKIVVTGKPDESSLYAQVASGKMPKGKGQLPDDQILAIADWIRNGAKND